MDQESSLGRDVGSKSKKRPHSRGSTTSIHSNATQPNTQSDMNHGFAGSPNLYATSQWLAGAGSQPRDLSATPQLSPESLILQHAPHMQNLNQEFPLDTPINVSMAHPAPPFQHHHQQLHQHHHQLQQRPPQHQRQGSLSSHQVHVDAYAANASFTDGDTQMMDRDDRDEGDSVTAPAAPTKSARSSANNELEMRSLFNNNSHRPLKDVARELRSEDRTAQSERSRQIFAMIWINSVCSKGQGSVPRGRVYAHYASRCAEEKCTVLNPASFGKLVRVIFPGLKTRRLGVRGESKYHYVNFALSDVDSEIREPQPQIPQPPPEPSSVVHDFNTSLSQSNEDRGQGSLPSPQFPSHDHQLSKSLPTHHSLGLHSVYNVGDLASFEDTAATSTKTAREIAFVSPAELAIDASSELPLPDIEPFLPKGTDPDAAKSLAALYCAHCIGLTESLRFCKEKVFWHLYTSFQGTLTMPVQKLFSNPELAPWIESCDLVAYQRMILITASLALQVLPAQVQSLCTNIAEKLVKHIRNSFQGQPEHVLRAKEAPATIFASLIRRLLNVNVSAHAAANDLQNPANRDQMYIEWIQIIQPRRLAECVPTRAMDDTVQLLINEIRYLLEPTDAVWETECLTIYGDVAARKGQRSGDAEFNNHDTFDRWITFLLSLPHRFPYASHTEIVWCVERIGTKVARDLTMNGGKSYSSWWTVKVFLDEMLGFIVEQGGFMRRKVTTVAKKHEVPVQPANRENTRHDATDQREGNDEEAPSPKMSHEDLGRAPFPPKNQETQSFMEAHVTDTHDDSGIGIRTPEDDFPMDKFTYTGSDSTDLVAGAE